MLDKRCIALLNSINDGCSGSKYKIFSVSELVSLMPERLSLDNQGLKEALTHLADYEFISIKYIDENEVCLRPLIKGRVVIENKIEKQISENSLNRKNFICAFFGALIGGVCSALIFYLINVVGGL